MSTADNPHLNHLLAALPADEMEALRPELETVPLIFKQVLYEAERPLEHVYFPHRAVVSLVAEMEDGSAVEVATVGPEGIVGLPIFLGDTTVTGRGFVQVPGEAARINAEAFRRALARTPKLHLLLSRYTLALLNLLAQNTACNRRHSVEERLARWDTRPGARAQICDDAGVHVANARGQPTDRFLDGQHFAKGRVYHLCAGPDHRH